MYVCALSRDSLRFGCNLKVSSPVSTQERPGPWLRMFANGPACLFISSFTSEFLGVDKTPFAEGHWGVAWSILPDTSSVRDCMGRNLFGSGFQTHQRAFADL